MCQRTFSCRCGPLWAPIQLLCFAALGGSAMGQPADPSVAGVYEVTANDVYVRSGGSLNHYPVCKLHAGDRVTVVTATSGWYEIRPPAGTFSLVHGDFVDSADDKSGVINGNNVRVRAGSQMSAHKYTVQRLLPKGTEVAILGRNPDGFVRILPPEGATLWIASEFVAPVRGGRVVRKEEPPLPSGTEPAATIEPMAAAESPQRGASSGDTESETPVREEPAPIVAQPAIGDPGGMLSALPATPQRQQLALIDADVEKELASPLLDRKLEPLIGRYRTVVDSDDEFAKRYAEARIDQLKTMVEIAETVRTVRNLGEKTDERRLEFLAERTERNVAEVPLPSGIDARGVLRVSALYPETRIPRRYRLVDTQKGSERTIAYVDVPQDFGMDMRNALGRYVGIRASQKRLLSGGVEPVPVLLAKEIVLLESPVMEMAQPVRD